MLCPHNPHKRVSPEGAKEGPFIMANQKNNPDQRGGYDITGGNPRYHRPYDPHQAFDPDGFDQEPPISTPADPTVVIPARTQVMAELMLDQKPTITA